MQDTGLWVGEHRRTGALWVFDPRTQDESGETIYLCSIKDLEVRRILRKEARSSLKTVRDHRKNTTIQKYERWWRSGGQDAIERMKERERKESERNNKAIQNGKTIAIENHKRYLACRGQVYAGVSEPDLDERISRCWRCTKRVGAIESVICNKCGWAVCTCGACGCGR